MPYTFGRGTLVSDPWDGGDRGENAIQFVGNADKETIGAVNCAIASSFGLRVLNLHH